MEWMNNWIQGIIIAVIIGTIIEMILPSGNCKKYIKVVIGVYILFSIISPVITKITGSNFEISNIFDIDQYIEASSKTSNDKTNTNQEEQIKQIYISNLKNDMKEKLKSKGYEINDIILEIANDNQYTLKKITINLQKKEETKTETNQNESIIASVNEVKINIASNSKTNTNNQTNTSEENIKSSLSSKEQNELKEYLSSVYQVEVKNITIN